MFDLLKKSISGFVGKITGKKGEKAPEPPEEKADFEVGGIGEAIAGEGPLVEKAGEEAEKKGVCGKPAPKKEAGPAEVRMERAAPGKEEEPPEPMAEAGVPEKKTEAPAPKAETPREEEGRRAEPLLKVGEVAEKEAGKLEKKVKKGLLGAVKETISGASEIKESEIGELLEELELGLLESDVALEVADEIKAELRKRVVGAKVQRGKTAEFIRGQLKEVMVGLVKSPKIFSMVERAKGGGKPVKVMVLGPNGAGKTTTIAKITKMLQDAGLSVAIAAADTFRAAAAEQLIHHGERLGVRVISGAYGSDPTALAFDAVEYAKANGIDVVLIDTAGRQDTNINLINQLKKMTRVIAPDMKIYVGESIAGNAIAEQATTFNREIGLDGVVLTKLDCDAKGGTVVSITKLTGVPIIYVGTGQGYADIEPFDAEKVIGEILS